MNYPRYVYAVKHNPTGKMYIGSSARPESRLLSHVRALKAHRHNVEDMQADYDKYGGDYTLMILDSFSGTSENALEYEWMRFYGSYERGQGYNYKDKAKAKLQGRDLIREIHQLPEDAMKALRYAAKLAPEELTEFISLVKTRMEDTGD